MVDVYDLQMGKKLVLHFPSGGELLGYPWRPPALVSRARLVVALRMPRDFVNARRIRCIFRPLRHSHYIVE